MPHQCTNCGRAFADGSKEMLSGCPNCGSNKFQFRPEGSVAAGGSADEGATGGDVAAGGAEGVTSSADAATDAETVGDGEENGAQAAARSEMVSSSDLPSDADAADGVDAGGPSGATPPETGASGTSGTSEAGGSGDGPTEPASEGADPDLTALREKLNDQFESIRILNPGQYELNLMELYDRDEYIISLREDGRYVIEMPETWGPGDE